MAYQELISSYNNKGLDITSLKQKLEVAKPLKGRLKYRAIDIISQRSALLNDINNLLITTEKPDKLEGFNQDTNTILQEYFSVLVNSIKVVKAWKFMGLIPSEYTLEKFEKLNKKQQFKMLLDLNKKYLNFLEYQKIADIRDCLKNANNLNDEIITKLEFLIQMFSNLKNKEIKAEFFCFDKAFLIALINFRKTKGLKLEDYMKNKGKHVQEEYMKFLQFFSNEDFREISENLDLTSKTLKNSASNIIEAYSEIAESEAEIYYIQEEFEEISNLENKYKRMQVVKIEHEKQKAVQAKIEKAQKIAEEKKQKELEATHKKFKKVNVEVKRTKNRTLNEKIEYVDDIYKVPKEQVNPLIFSWLEREDVTLTRRVGNKDLTMFFEKIKEIELRTGIRVALYIVTNVGKEVALKRLNDFKKKAAQHGLPNLVDGVLGGYSSFRINKDGKITSIAEMTESNREKIIKLLEKTNVFNFSRDLIEQSETNYVRYQIVNKKDKSTTKNYLNLLVSNLLKDEKIRKQPLKFLLFMEGKVAGIDVLFEAQLKGITKLSDYYKEKYSIAPGKTMNVRIDTIKSFIEE